MIRIHSLSNHLERTTVRKFDVELVARGNVHHNRIKAVLFDLDRVIVPNISTLFEEYEVKVGLLPGTLLKVIKYDDEEGLWGMLKRGELSWSKFCHQFSNNYSKMNVRSLELGDLFETLQHSIERQSMVRQLSEAILCMRAEGIKTALITCNRLDETSSHSHVPFDRRLFDVVVESGREDIRQPDPQIHHSTLAAMNVEAHEVVLLHHRELNPDIAKRIGCIAIKVTEPQKAVNELGRELGFDVRAFAPGTIAVPKHLELPVDKLKAYLDRLLKTQTSDDPVVRCYAHGQSNPTYFVKYGDSRMVLRKKPPGKLLPSAHAVDREYRVMKAVRNHGVPVPEMLGFCDDSSLLGTPFYVMEYVEGRIFKDPSLPDMSPHERRQIYSSMCQTLAKIHSVDITEAGLDDFGRKGGFMSRNFKRWAGQLAGKDLQTMPVMEKLMKWLSDRMPTDERCTLMHGDYKLDNVVIHPTRPEVIAVLDWELSTLGDPRLDLAHNCMAYYLPEDFPAQSLPGVQALTAEDLSRGGLPTADKYVEQYMKAMSWSPQNENWLFYVVFTLGRGASIIHGVYTRFKQGQAASPKAKAAGDVSRILAETGWRIACNSSIGPNATRDTFSKSSITTPGDTKNRTSSTMSRKDEIFTSSSNSSWNPHTSQGRDIPGVLPLSMTSLSPKAQDYYTRMKDFINKEIVPVEKACAEHWADPGKKWKVNPILETLKAKARSQGLWNLFLPKESDPKGIHGAQLTNVEYAYFCEEMGKYPVSSEVFNCSGPDSGNIEVLVRYGTPEHHEKWLKPLLQGEIRSCFGMTEPAVASSDATNIQSSIRRDGDSYVINGHKWWTSGVLHPHCKLCIFMGKTNTDGPIHRQQSMILVPMDAPGITVVRHLTALGYDDASHGGHAEVLFDNVRVPASNLLLGEGRGFEIAQGRLGPGRIHHCMRLIGAAEQALQLMVDRAQDRVAFGKPLAAQSTIQQDIANSRIEIEQCRLLVLKAAHMMDTVGNKVAAPEIAMIKVATPKMANAVIDRAIQVHGGAGMSADFPLAHSLMLARMIRIADGPDEVHLRSVAGMTFKDHGYKRVARL